MLGTKLKIADKFKIILGQLFPLYLLLLVCYPMLIGVFIDSDLINPLMFGIGIFWMLVFTTPFAFFQKTIFYYLGVAFYFIIGLAEILHWLIMKGPLTTSSLLNIFNSNMEEAMDFINLKLSLSLALVLLHILFFILAVKFPPKIKKTTRHYLGVLGIMAIPVSLFLVLFFNMPKVHLVPTIAKVSYAFGKELKEYEKAIAENEPKTVDALAPEDVKQQVCVLIIGESLARRRMSVYGFELQTNPKLSKRNDLFVFNNVISPYSYTTLSVPSLLSNSNIDNDIPFSDNLDLIDVFKSAGYKTYWLSNQSQVGIWDNMVSSIGNKADHTEFINARGNSSQEAILSRSYDSRLFEPFKEVLMDKADKKLIVIHLMGSHNTYSKRYPEEFEKFKGGSDKEQVIAEYHNSILFNDFVVDSLFSTLKSYSTEGDISSYAIYLADHGENLYDEQNRIGHDFSKVMPKSNVEIPFILWTSDTFREINSEKIKALNERTDWPYMSDDLYHSFIDLSRIKTPVVDKDRSIFHQSFKPVRKRIMADELDYDRPGF